MNSLAHEKLVVWITSIIGTETNNIIDIDALWELPITRDQCAPLGFNISAQFLLKKFEFTLREIGKYRELTYPLIDEMLKLGVVVIPKKPNEIASVDARRRLLNWYRKFTLEDKKALPIFSNVIAWKKIPKTQQPVGKADLSRYSIVKEAWGEIHADLRKLGVLSSDYKTVKERIIESSKKRREKGELKGERFDRLAFNKLHTQSDFLEPTISFPFVQIEQLFAVQSLSVASDSGKSNYRIACNVFIEYLVGVHGDSPFYVYHGLNEHIFVRFRKHLQQEIIAGKVSSSHANTVLSSVRISLTRLEEVNGLNYTFFDINGFETQRATDAKKPFSKLEKDQLLDAIAQELTDSRLRAKPYEKTGIGENPLNNKHGRIPGKSTLDNARWLFENKLSCRPIHFNTIPTPIGKAFLAIIQSSEMGLQEVYAAWRVTTMVTADLVYPYILELAKVTGMNVDPLLSLNIDDYVECHPATSRPCLRYWKERSDGHKDYHLDLFNAEISWLTMSQAKVVKRIFKEIVSLTSSFRNNIEDAGIKQRLFVYQTDGVKGHGKALPFLGKVSTLGRLSRKFIDKYKIMSNSGFPTLLNISRFRPTFVSEMIDNGVSLREIQLMLGHSSIAVTIQYLDSLDFNSIARKKLNDKLKEIHESTLDAGIKEEEKSSTVKNKPKVIFRTPLGGCKNIFDPPSFVKKLSTYVPGSPCSLYNKCLGCDNVIITAINLPEIFAMQRDYMHVLNHSRVLDTPYGYVVRENLELIDEITNPEESDFSLTELEEGKRLAEFVTSTILVDGVSL